MIVCVRQGKTTCLKSSRRPSDLEEQRRKKTDSSSVEKVADKNRVHSFILDLELGTVQGQRQRTASKSERNLRKDAHGKEKERKEREPGVSDDRLKHKLKTESRRGAETPTPDEKDEKKSAKVKADRKTSVFSREHKTSVSDTADEGNLKKAKTDALKEKAKAEKTSVKSELKPLRRLDSTGSSEERSEVEAGSEVSRRKDKLPRDPLKRSKSQSEVKPADKLKVRVDRKDSLTGEREKNLQKSGSETDGETRKAEVGPKVKSLSEKHRSKSREDLKSQKPDKKDTKSRVEKKSAEEPQKTKDTKTAKKTAVKKVAKDSENKQSSDSPTPADGTEPFSVDDPYAALSDVTPESDTEEPRSVSGEADALLSLMTAASDIKEQETEADLKMKEAALTLLSMDPDTARSTDAMVAMDLTSDLVSGGETPPPGRESGFCKPEKEKEMCVSASGPVVLEQNEQQHDTGTTHTHTHTRAYTTHTAYL